MNKDFELVPHTADFKMRVWGNSLEELFHNALVGMFQIIKPHAKGCTYKNERLVCPNLPIQHEIELHAHDVAELLVNFLSQALALSDINNEAYLGVTIHELNEHHIKAIIHGVTIQGFEVVEIKAVTYHDLHIVHNHEMWQTDIVFDI